MRNVQLLLEYDGANYAGWQIQKNAMSIQQKVMEALNKITNEKVHLIGAGRTDSGVHAYAQSANFHTESKIPINKIPLAINSFLPSDIRIIKAIERTPDFHSRYHAKGKIYQYKIINNLYGSALLRDKIWHIPKDINYDQMVKASEHFIGQYDFMSFMSSGSSVKDTIRTIYRLDINKVDEFITLEIEGNGFLYNMVRIIVGTLVMVGQGKIKTDKIVKIIESKDRNQAGITAPARGLYLKKVIY